MASPRVSPASGPPARSARRTPPRASSGRSCSGPTSTRRSGAPSASRRRKRSRSRCSSRYVRGGVTRMDVEKESDMVDRRHFLKLAGVGVVAFVRPAGTVAQSPLKIGSVGAGRMGSALGGLFVKAGHPVMFSSRHPENLTDLVQRLGPLAQAGTVEQAIAFGDVVVMVVPYTALEEIGRAHGPALAAKPLVLDICNPIARRDGAELVKRVEEQGGAGPGR